MTVLPKKWHREETNAQTITKIKNNSSMTSIHLVPIIKYYVKADVRFGQM